MPLSIDRALGIHEDALTLRARRTELLATNVANADTPDYKARDIDFRAALEQAQSGQGVHMQATHAGHIQESGSASSPEVLFRVPDQPSLDGNTVDPQREQAAFAENAVQYQATLMFLNRRIASLRGALSDQ